MPEAIPYPEGRYTPPTLPVIQGYYPYNVYLQKGKVYLWCACGMSDTSPFCNAACNKAITRNRPIYFNVSESGYYKMCQCKLSANAPFCNGTHKDYIKHYATTNRGKLEILGPDSPFSGQVSGVLYWVKEAGEDYFKRRLRDAVLSVDRKLKDVRDAVAKGIDRLMGAFSGKTDKDPGSDPGSDAAVAAVAKAIHAAREQVAAVAAEADQPAKAKLGPGANEKAQDKFERTARFTGS